MELIKSTLPFIQIIVSVLLVASILLQRSENGLGSAFGGSSAMGNPLHTKRGLEKKLFITTIILGIIFLASAVTAFYLKTV